MNYGDHNFIENTQQSRESHISCRESRTRRVKPVELVVSVESICAVQQCMGSTSQTCRVMSSRAKWNLGLILVREA